jgi:hypothetical protein
VSSVDRIRKEFEGKVSPDFLEDALNIIRMLESGEIKPRVVDYTGNFPNLEQGELK